MLKRAPLLGLVCLLQSVFILVVGSQSHTLIFVVCMEIKLSVNHYVTRTKRVRPGHITLTLKTGPQMTYKKEKHE